MIAGLSSGVVLGALGCGPQCFLNAVLGDFAFGDEGSCVAEAFIHLVGMEIQFCCVAAIAHRTYIGVVKLQPYSQSRSLRLVSSIWLFSISGTIVTGNFSKPYLVASGTFCFYAWDSPALVFFAWPLAIVSILCTGYWYYYTFRFFSSVREGAAVYEADTTSDVGGELAARLAGLVTLFALGYFGIISQSVYELFVGRAKAWGDVVAAVCVLIYWQSVPFAYAIANRRLGVASLLCCCPQLEQTESTSVGHSKHSLRRTRPMGEFLHELSVIKTSSEHSKSSTEDKRLPPIETPRFKVNLELWGRRFSDGGTTIPPLTYESPQTTFIDPATITRSTEHTTERSVTMMDHGVSVTRSGTIDQGTLIETSDHHHPKVHFCDSPASRYAITDQFFLPQGSSQRGSPQASPLTPATRIRGEQHNDSRTPIILPAGSVT